METTPLKPHDLTIIFVEATDTDFSHHVILAFRLSTTHLGDRRQLLKGFDPILRDLEHLTVIDRD